jgi:hypothetical protein
MALRLLQNPCKRRIYTKKKGVGSGPSTLQFILIRSHLHARGDKLALCAGVLWPSTSKDLSVLLGILLDASLELWTEMSNQTLNGPCESLTKS